MRAFITTLLSLLLAATPAFGATTFLEPGGDATYGLEFWSTVSGSPTVVSDIVRSGHQRSIRFAPNSVNYVQTTGTVSDAGGRASAYLYLAALPATIETIVIVGKTTNQKIYQVRLTSAGVLQVWADGIQVGSDGATLSTGVWYRLSVAWTITSTSVNEFRLSVDGSSSISVTNVTISSTGSNFLRYGLDSADTTLDIRLSDVYLDNSAALTDTGNVQVTAKRPNANGTTNGWLVQIGAGGSGYGSGHSPQVNERAHSTTNGWQTALLSTTEEYSIESAATGDADLTGATIIDSVCWVYASASTSVTASIKCLGSTSSISLTTTNTLFTTVSASASYPAGNTDIGIVSSGSAATKSLYEAGIVLAYLPAAAATQHFLHRRAQ